MKKITIELTASIETQIEEGCDEYQTECIIRYLFFNGEYDRPGFKLTDCRVDEGCKSENNNTWRF